MSSSQNSTSSAKSLVVSSPTQPTSPEQTGAAIAVPVLADRLKPWDLISLLELRRDETTNGFFCCAPPGAVHARLCPNFGSDPAYVEEILRQKEELFRVMTILGQPDDMSLSNHCKALAASLLCFGPRGTHNGTYEQEAVGENFKRIIQQEIRQRIKDDETDYTNTERSLNIELFDITHSWYNWKEAFCRLMESWAPSQVNLELAQITITEAESLCMTLKEGKTDVDKRLEMLQNRFWNQAENLKDEKNQTEQAARDLEHQIWLTSQEKAKFETEKALKDQISEEKDELSKQLDSDTEYSEEELEDESTSDATSSPDSSPTTHQGQSSVNAQTQTDDPVETTDVKEEEDQKKPNSSDVATEDESFNMKSWREKAKVKVRKEVQQENDNKRYLLKRELSVERRRAVRTWQLSSAASWYLLWVFVAAVFTDTVLWPSTANHEGYLSRAMAVVVLIVMFVAIWKLTR